MNYFTTPKADFIASADNVKNHHVVVENPIVRRGIEIALAEMQRRSAAGTDPANFNACAASHLRMLGAHDFVEIFLNLGETMQPGVRTDTNNLPGNVRPMPQPNKKN